jgi:hypothetical protein
VALPNITDVFYGRDVGYNVEQIVLDEATEEISATKIRRPAARPSDPWGRALRVMVWPPGRQLVTLEDAARYIQKLPKAEQQIKEWQTAVDTRKKWFSNTAPTALSWWQSFRCSVPRHRGSPVLVPYKQT